MENHSCSSGGKPWRNRAIQYTPSLSNFNRVEAAEIFNHTGGRSQRTRKAVTAAPSFDGMAAARVRRHRRTLQRLAHIRAAKGVNWRMNRHGLPRAR